MDLHSLLFASKTPNSIPNVTSVDVLEDMIRKMQQPQTPSKKQEKKRNFSNHLTGEKIAISGTGTEQTPLPKSSLMKHHEVVPVDRGTLVSVHKGTSIFALNVLQNKENYSFIPLKSRVTNVLINPVNPNHFMTSFQNGLLFSWIIDVKAPLKDGVNPRVNFCMECPFHIVQAKWHPNKENLLVVITSENQLMSLDLFQLSNYRGVDNVVKFQKSHKGVKILFEDDSVKVNDISFSQALNVMGAVFSDGNVEIFDSINFIQIATFLAIGGGGNANSINFCVGPAFHYVIIGGPGNKSFFLWRKMGTDFELSQTVTFNGTNSFNRVHYDGHTQHLVFTELGSDIIRCMHVGKHSDSYSFDYISELMISEPIVDFAFDHGREKHSIEIVCISTGEVSKYNILERYLEKTKSEVGKQDKPQLKVKDKKDIPTTPEKSMPLLKKDHKKDRGTDKTKEKSQPVKVLARPVEKENNYPPTDNLGVTQLRKFESSIESKILAIMEKAFDREEQSYLIKQQPVNGENSIKQTAIHLSNMLIDATKSISSSLEDKIASRLVPSMNQDMAIGLQKEFAEFMQNPPDSNLNFDDAEILHVITKGSVPSLIQNSIRMGIAPFMRQTSYDLDAKLDKRIDIVEDIIATINNRNVTKLESKVASMSPRSPMKLHLPVVDRKQICESAAHLLQQQKYNDAFVRILNTGDPEILYWFLSQVTPIIVQELNQSILLALFVQLSHHLFGALVINMKWTKSILDYLDVEDPLISETVGNILEEILEIYGKMRSQVPVELIKKYNRQMHIINSLYQSSDE